MVQPTYVAALHELKTWPAPEDQLKLLRLLKNDIVGHGQRKELAVRLGLLDPLAGILRLGDKSTLSNPIHSTLHQDIRMQAILIIGSLANAGPAFIPPILASNVLPSLLHSIQPPNASIKMVIATLRTLNNLTSAWADLLFSEPTTNHLSLPSLIMTKPTLGGFLQILQPHKIVSMSAIHQQQIALTADLIANCCLSDPLKNTMVTEGILDALADILASYALHSSHSSSTYPTSSTDSHLVISSVLNALSQIIEGSDYRAHRLIYSPAPRRILRLSNHHSFYQAAHPSTSSHGHSSADAVPVDSLLPRVMIQKSSFGSSSFPPLALSNSRLLPDRSGIEAPPSSPLCAWLIHLARSLLPASARLAALRLLALVSNALDADAGGSRPELVPTFKERERQIALLAVPIAVKLVKDFASDTHTSSEAMALKGTACSVLARLIKNNVELQKAAHNSDAHKYVAQILRKSFDPVTLARPMWSPHTQAPDPQLPTSPSTTLGDAGLPQEILHALKCRAGALQAVAAISEREDTIRKDLIEAGVATHIIDSLTTFPDAASTLASVTSIKEGNTVPVILAACQAATAMSRSVGNLRTSLIDAGLGKPIFALLTHPNNAVQIAATDVSINLVLDFSPMREDLIKAGVIRIFCMHAKRSSPKLRQVSLWGLKHLVLNAPQNIKHTCLEELGSGWLIQAINGEQHEAQAGHSLGLGSSNAQGDQVDLLKSPHSLDMDIDIVEKEDSDDEEGEVTYDQSGTAYQPSGIRTTLQATSYKSRLRMFHEREFNTAFRARQDDILIQEQALDFIRNLINGDDNIPMIDHLNNTIGANRIFDMLYNKLKPAAAPAAQMHGFGFTQHRASPQSASNSTNPSWQPPELIRAALGVMIHLAAGSTKHRQQLVAQKQLLTAWLPHFGHHDRQVRVSCVWGVINLTWPETSGDREDARRRAMELREMGIEERVRSLEKDPDLDVRERVKTAVRQIDDLLGEGRHR